MLGEQAALDSQGVVSALKNVAITGDAGDAIATFEKPQPIPALVVIECGAAFEACKPYLHRWQDRSPCTQIIGFGFNQVDHIQDFYASGGHDLVPEVLASPQLLAGYFQAKLRRFHDQTIAFSERQRLSGKTISRTKADSLALPSPATHSGKQVQKQLMPSEALVVGKTTIASDMRPAGELAGDFVQFDAVGEEIVLACLADVSGHDAGSALVTVWLHEQFRNMKAHLAAKPNESLADLMSTLNKALCDAVFGHHATCVLMRLDLKRNVLDYCVAGHFPHPLLVQKGQAQALETSDLPLGLLESKEYDSHQLELDQSFALWVCSDGVLAEMPGDTVAAQERWLRSFVENDSGEIDGVFDRLFEVSNEGLSDDASVVSLVRKV